MIWESWSDFFAMGGYALYVWGSFAAVVVFMAGEVVVVKMRARSVREQLVRAAHAPRMGGRA